MIFKIYRKRIREILFLAFLFSTHAFIQPVISQQKDENQADRRIQKPLQIGGLVLSNISLMNTSYSFNKLISFTLTGAVHRGGVIGPPLDFEKATASIVVPREKSNISANIALLGMEVYPFEKIPIYITAFIGSEKRNNQIVQEYFTLNPFAESFLQPSSFSYTITPKRSGFIGMGIGFKWIFASGIFLGFQHGGYYRSIQKDDLYVYNDFRLNARAASLEQIWIYQKYLESRLSPGQFSHMFYLYLGLSF
ncbi:hypothetical protein [Leptospira weilii]|uniref:hypothetical protein n=1 Tax=Leptospira weilii TaxID=28184 RepID=UPI00031B7D47|nr:hypothetical protein [Leptospira weilii]OMI17420.1 hypothetical protein BUQ74_10000 [Leptospira weilii serovar Heyan]